MLQKPDMEYRYSSSIEDLTSFVKDILVNNESDFPLKSRRTGNIVSAGAFCLILGC